ncbi:hypothetical protein CROQUDRAFT_709427 [Cronartium quercuum f. sp. fusiforme G11]|uniref:Cation-transporting ATPase n=1 Tax=Cronartium quercuum f. sp. fusiforme G11 TaxID=708437 RepID=A0A9P6NPG4_9BASI|nr:hypothetical protein CROQUDRAFT_709427 [Cronartium quercuum f. sp. fusiforme G11]
MSSGHNSNRRRSSTSRSIRSAASSWYSIKSTRHKSRLAPASYRDNPDDESFPDVDDSDYEPTISSASTSTTNSDPSSSDSSNSHRSTRRDALGLAGPGTDSRIEIIPLTSSYHPDEALSLDDTKLVDSSSRQSVYLVDEDMQIQFFGWVVVLWKVGLWRLGCVCSGGLLWLIGRWKTAWMLNCRGTETKFTTASHLVVNTNTGASQVVRLETLVFNDPLPLPTVFPPSLRKPPACREAAAADTAVSVSSEGQPALERPSTRLSSDTLAQSCGSSSAPADIIHLTHIKYFDFRYHRFFLHPITMQFRMARDWQDPAWSVSLSHLAKGLTEKDSASRSQLFSDNVMEVKGKTTVQLLIDEALHPFYLFQIASIILWSIDDYYYYALCIAAISISSVLTTLVETKRNLARMQELSRFTCEVMVLRGTKWMTASSIELVPGDVIDVSAASLHTFPADLLLLSGDAIVNESMLTGESIPVSKLPAIDSTLKAMYNMVGDPSPTLAKHILFCGTKIIRIRKSGRKSLSSSPAAIDDAARAMVIRTAFNTTKGALVRSMLFPKPMDFAFYRDSFRFIGALTLIAGFGFIASAINFLRMGIRWETIMVRALDLITIVVPPALPATMSIGTSFAMSRLRKLGIFCVSPNRVNIGGKINLVCFDKTGTLTEEGLDVLGVRTVNRQSGDFSELYDEIEDVPILGADDSKTPLRHALATCHGLKVVNGQVIGDPLDLKMFQFTRWSIEEGDQGSALAGLNHSVAERQAALVQTIVRPPGGKSFEIEDAMKSTRFLELGIIRTFDFASELRRMSVLVKKLKSSTVEAYVKGAPEAMYDICLKESLPKDYDESLTDYTRNGYRVIAVAAKSFPKLTWLKAQRLTRADVESELRFLGFIIFENKLKPGTEPSIYILKNAHIGVKMCTGDNIRTAISVGRECAMISPSARVYMPVFASGSQAVADSRIVWFDIDSETKQLDPYTLRPIFDPTDDEEQSIPSSCSSFSTEYILAVSGDVFRWIVDYGSPEIVQRMLYKTVIFARMSPDEKHELVERLQALDYTVGFCGDGANDCGALKAADVGLSLSEAEASVAAPFTSRVPDISCFIEVIREGRCALVTSFSCFKYMALYSLIQFTTITLLYSLPSSLGDFQFLYIDLFVIIPIAIAMGRTHPYGKIVPKRPTANLVSKRVLISLIGQIIINSTIQAIVFRRVRSQDWYHETPQPDPEAKLPTSNPENSTLFLVSIFQYVLVAATFSVGPPYRKEMFTNSFLVLCLAALGGFSTYMLFIDSGLPYRILELVPLSHEFRLELALFVILNVFTSIAFETYATQPVALWLGGRLKQLRRLWNRNNRQSGKRDRKLYKLIAESMD